MVILLIKGLFFVLTFGAIGAIAGYLPWLVYDFCKQPTCEAIHCDCNTYYIYGPEEVLIHKKGCVLRAK